eukprot:CAMPEP_0169194976 /NCGR_PEP_ID=MMETSP1016-20121227/6971_1 /TAXON_ID=342587 /ORGANISM="Karlodinium micrum, Strain CCMP2283" /LENGTH=134 /DNA_ID=CAMNT_0009271491 /DNA_START=545 /DNA_END=949 /DNA_ORIENTATION=-
MALTNSAFDKGPTTGPTNLKSSLKRRGSAPIAFPTKNCFARSTNSLGGILKAFFSIIALSSTNIGLASISAAISGFIPSYICKLSALLYLLLENFAREAVATDAAAFRWLETGGGEAAQSSLESTLKSLSECPL